MALTGYLKIDDIAGESKHADHEDEIDVHAVHWEIRQTSSARLGSGRTRSRTEISSIHLYKWYDAASPYLALSAMRGTSIAEATLVFRKGSGDAHLDYLKITMSDCMISRYEILDPDSEGGEADLQLIREKIGISCEKIKLVYTAQSNDHSTGDEHEVEYDIVAAA